MGITIPFENQQFRASGSAWSRPSRCGTKKALATLKDAGLVKLRRAGRCVYYRVEPRGMKPLIDWIAHYRAF